MFFILPSFYLQLQRGSLLWLVDDIYQFSYLIFHHWHLFTVQCLRVCYVSNRGHAFLVLFSFLSIWYISCWAFILVAHCASFLSILCNLFVMSFQAACMVSSVTLLVEVSCLRYGSVNFGLLSFGFGPCNLVYPNAATFFVTIPKYQNQNLT